MSLASYHCSTPGYCFLLSCRRRSCCRGSLGASARMSLEETRRSELAELVADHVFGHEQLHEVLAVVHHEGVPDEVGDDGAIPRPRLDRLTAAGALLLFDFRQQALVDIR